MTTKTETPTPAEVQRQKLLKNIAGAKDERNELLLKLNANPDDAGLHDQIAQLEREAAEYESTLARLDAGEAAAAKAQSKEARKARYDHLKATRQRVADTNGKTEALAAKLQETFDSLGPLFAQLQLAIEQRASDAQAILAATRTGSQQGEVARGLLDFQAGEITEAFANLVAGTGLAATAIRLDPYVTVSAPSQLFAKYTLGDAVAKTNAKLLDVLDRRLAAGKAMILGGAHV